MCGIVGVVGREAGRVASYGPVVDRVLDHMAYRGPDARGMWKSEHVILGHRRLSIIDLSEQGSQPLHDTDNRLHISFNGEIYNYRELASILTQRGYRLRTKTDTEVILGAYHHFGDEFLGRLRGMFAFILFDEPRRRVILARDRLGKKPLYYALNGEELIAASELKAFYAFRHLRHTLDIESLRDFFSLQYIPGPYTILKEVLRVSPGECLILDLPGWRVHPRRYWGIRAALDSVDSPVPSEDDIARTIEESTEYRLIADVEIGVLLSGGIDSSLLSCFAAGLSKSPLRAFVVSFQDKDLDEVGYARNVAGCLGMELVEVEGDHLKPETFEKVIFHGDEPLGDPACIPTYMIAEAISRYVTVVISGEGADEIFWGYDHYRREIRLRSLIPRMGMPWLPRGARAALGRIEADPRVRGPWQRLCKLLQSTRDVGPSSWMLVFGESAVDALFTPGLFTAPARYTRRFNELLCELRGARTEEEASLAVDLAFWLPDDLLMKVDRMTMAHSLEARAPFVDHRLVEMALGFPARGKVDASSGKLILRRILANRLPPDLSKLIAGRGKHGFGVPLRQWLMQDLRERAEAVFAESALSSVGLLSAKHVRRLWSMYKQYGGGLAFERKLWVLLCFLAWHGWHERRFGL